MTALKLIEFFNTSPDCSPARLEGAARRAWARKNVEFVRDDRAGHH